MSQVNLARRERDRLADTALLLGAEAGTTIPDWTVADLLAHLLVRERQPYGAPGIVIGALSGLTDLAMRRAARAGFEAMVVRFRDPRFTPFRIGGLDRLANTLEFFVHHEDLRRGQPDWSPRGLPLAEQDELWIALKRMAKPLLRRAGTPVTLRRSDTRAEARVRPGNQPVLVSGTPEELVLFCFGRQEYVEVIFDGPEGAVAQVRAGAGGF